MINGLDLFSGIGGLTLALADWVQPVAYCENDRAAISILLSRMASGHLPTAPVWDCISTIREQWYLPSVDICYGGFPCQDISVAGAGAGLDGKRSRLFWEVVWLCSDIRPRFIFLENVPAITTRGGTEVVGAFTSLGYDCRWCVISAANVGANHKRERWFLLAYSHGKQHESGSPEKCGPTTSELLAYSDSPRKLQPQRSKQRLGRRTGNSSQKVANSNRERSQRLFTRGFEKENPILAGPSWWAVEPNVARVADGVPQRMDRIKCLGNAVVPLQAKTAFETLMGLTG